MATATLKKKLVYGPNDNGIVVTPAEFDRADFAEGWRYELINGVLVVSPIPSIQELDPNDHLGYWLRTYQESHPQGSALNLTLPEWIIRTRTGRRRSDRVIWAGLGRLPKKNETPTIVAEFVSARRRDRERDYETKRDEFMAIHVKEYWVIDRFERILTVFTKVAGKIKKRIIREGQVYRTPLLPGFELPLADLLAVADRWQGQETEEED